MGRGCIVGAVPDRNSRWEERALDTAARDGIFVEEDARTAVPREAR